MLWLILVLKTKLGNNKLHSLLYSKWASPHVSFFVTLSIDLTFACAGWTGVEKGDNNTIDTAMSLYHPFSPK